MKDSGHFVDIGRNICPSSDEEIYVLVQMKKYMS